MIRPRPAQINEVALAVESDEALNPVDVGVLGPDAFVRRIAPACSRKSGAIHSLDR